MPEDPSAAPIAPVGLNHLVINVRNLAESHRFWTEILGFALVGEVQPRPDSSGRRGTMRFYSGDHGGGRRHHHDIALVETPALPPPSADGAPTAIGHIAIALPDREAWLRQLRYLQSRGVAFDRRVEHGMTHSLYIRDPNGYSVELLYELPREVWEGDIQSALDHYVALPTDGEAALVDRTDDIPMFRNPVPA